jgi:hypothetical protein
LLHRFNNKNHTFAKQTFNNQPHNHRSNRTSRTNSFKSNKCIISTETEEQICRRLLKLTAMVRPGQRPTTMHKDHPREVHKHTNPSLRAITYIQQTMATRSRKQIVRFLIILSPLRKFQHISKLTARPKKEEVGGGSSLNKRQSNLATMRGNWVELETKFARLRCKKKILRWYRRGDLKLMTY